MTMQANRPMRFLLVEDSPGDVELTRAAMAEAKVSNVMSVVRDGVEAMDFLRKEGEYADAERPDLILLDLNMPRMDGREVLKAIKGDPGLACIPVVVLTTSNAEQDVLKSYNLHANAYITKPVDFDHFIKVVQTIEEFWLVIVTLPKAA